MMPAPAVALPPPRPLSAREKARGNSPWEIGRAELLTAEDYHALQPELAPPPLAPERPFSRQPERKLLLAHLTSVLSDVFKLRDKEDVGEDLWWVFYDPEPMRPQGFEYTCEALAIDASELRRWLAAALERCGRMLSEMFCTRMASYAARRILAVETGNLAWSPPVPKGAFLFPKVSRTRRIQRDLPRITPHRGRPPRPVACLRGER